MSLQPSLSVLRPKIARTRSLIAIAALSAVALVTPALVAQEAAAPEAPKKVAKIAVDEKIHTTEETSRDSIAEHTFVLSNEGDAPLVISRVVSTGNVEIPEKPTEIAPGGKFSLVARTDLMKEAAGAILKKIEVQSNDPANPSFVLEFRIVSVEYVQPRPDRARWISVQQEMNGTITSVFKAVDGKPFRVTGTTTPPAGIDVKLVPADAAGNAAAGADPSAPSGTWRVEMTLRKDAPVGAILGPLVVNVDHPKQKQVPIPLSGFMRPVIAVTPHELKLEEVPAETARELSFFVRNFATEPIHVTRVETTLAGFGEAKIEAKELGRRYDVKVPMDLSKVPAGPLRGTIRIHTDSAKVPFYSVPVEALVLPAAPKTN